MDIGLLRLSALGDVILWSALLEYCQRHYPKASLTWMTCPHWQPLFPGLFEIEWFHVDKPQSIKDYWLLRKQLKHQHFNTLLCGQASLRTNLIYPLIKADHKIGFDSRRGREGHQLFTDTNIEYKNNHLLEGFAQFFAAANLPIDLNDLRWPVGVSEQAQDFAQSTLPKDSLLIGLVLCASKTERTWPLKSQITFLKQLISHTESQIVLIGGSTSTELTMAEAIWQWHAQEPTAKNRLINLVGKTSLTTLTAILNQLDCLVSPDTGPAHLAHALGTPVVGLYAVARAGLSGPYKSTYTIDAYSEAAQHCDYGPAEQLDWHQRIHHPKAMSVISPERVLKSVEHVLSDL